MSSVPTATPRTFLGHPLGLYVLFFTEMWERFSYYGMRALLILYMVNYFKWGQKDASTVYKMYTSLVYVTPILGGYLADRYLGNRLAVIIGATLMAIGHFLMAFEAYDIFFAALVFLILGNGMFKPNMSTQVGRLYPKNDGRIDAAYTIFYMGINLGAFLSPLVCGWLAENTVGGYHSGFTMAGIGMVFGLVIYLLGQPAINELPPDLVAVNPRPDEAGGPKPLTEAEAAAEPSVLGRLARLVPGVLALLGGAMAVGFPLLWLLGRLHPADALMLGIAGVSTVLMGYVTAQVRGGVRDRVLSILVLGLFVIFFWGAYEQAGNVLNLWADKHTDRYLTRPMELPPLFPEVHEDAADEDGQTPRAPGVWTRFTTLFRLKVDPHRPAEGWAEWLTRSLNPVPTTWFQAINALAIVALGPIFAWLWIWLDRRGWQPSIPLKMFLGLVLMSASVAVMIEAARREDRETVVRYPGILPPGIEVKDGIVGHLTDEGAFEPFHAGRLRWSDGELRVLGVLPDNERDHLVEQTAPAAFRDRVDELVKASSQVSDEDAEARVAVEPPPGFDLRYAGLKRSVLRHDRAAGALIAYQPLQDKERKGLLVAAGEPRFRAAVNELYVESSRFRVSSGWLFWSYILATLGELCLSPVGLAMVSKLAPARFATMLMGVWFLTTALGNFAAGSLGEVWGIVPPVDFFLYTTAAVAVAAGVLLLIVRLLGRMMHGVS